MSHTYKDYLDDVDSHLAPAKERAQRYIENGIWDIDIVNLDNWIKNFKENDEKFLCALLLDQFSLRTISQTNALLHHSFRASLPSALCDDPLDAHNMPDYIAELSDRSNKTHNLRLVPVIRDSDPPTKSGPSVARLYRRCLKISDSNMIWPWQIESALADGVDKIVFIDDVVGSGQQFQEFLKKHMPASYSEEIKFCYIPIIAHVDGLDNIKIKYPEISICPVEIADKESNFFMRNGTKEIHDLKELYERVSEKLLNKRLNKGMCFGYQNLSMTISFSHATPNATLPLYWYESSTFSPLVGR